MKINGTNRDDTLTGTADGDVIHLGDGNDEAGGWGGNDIIFGGDGMDKLRGNDGNDQLYGGEGADLLWGGEGRDLVQGGGGGDVMWGGAGADTFKFVKVTGGHLYDLIADFSKFDGDRIDLSDIDANWDVAGNQAFRHIDNAAFSGRAGELRWTIEVFGGNAMTFIEMDTDGDARANFTIQVNDGQVIRPQDVIL